ncbi:ArdC-like ssDNA-binding domain-containing protein [Virgibacillus sediminis]|uniref:ArdC-like ssDNA-binding domain-containing protein n=1 Tax=Virgibacillus sediminis TaxID=202260 RepID=A0ABV7A1S0_9BACI
MLLDDGEYATFKQIKEAGGKVKKGSKSHIVVFWKMIEVEVEDQEGEEEKKKVPLMRMRYYRVFKIGEQTEGIDPKQELEKFDHDPIEEAEKSKKIISMLLPSAINQVVPGTNPLKII